jgi:HTH-type transcriptional repressor of puuD
MNIGCRIIELREAQGLTTNALSKLAGVAQSHLREIEMGNKQPGIEVLEKICNALGMTLGDFFADNKDMSAGIKRLVRAVERLSPSQLEYITKFIESL